MSNPALDRDDLDEDEARGIPPEVTSAVRRALGIATEAELAAAIGENRRTTQSKRVLGTDVLPHVRRGRNILYILPLVGEELRRRAEGRGLEVTHRRSARGRKAS